MKKKLLPLLVIALVVALTCLTACNALSSTLNEINKLLRVSYSKITLNVETTYSEVTLKGVYVFTFDGDTTTIEYTVDKLNEPNTPDGLNDGYKSTVTGTAVVVDGNLVENSTNTDLSEASSLGGISFKPAFFKNCKTTNVRFEADVAQPKGFTGNKDLQCTNMHVKVLHKANALTQMIITYVAQNGSNVSLTYLFTK